MPLASQIVGRSGKPVVHDVDARWTMAYAAGLGDHRPAYLDTRARPDVLAHPLFPVCFEWPVFLSADHLPSTPDLSVDERVRGVHATHDLTLHRPVRAGMQVTTTATVVRVERRKPGAYQVTRLDSVDSEGSPVATTFYGMLFRGVEVVGGDRIDGDGPELPTSLEERPAAEIEIFVAEGAAHVYTECARIWNPIHTDAAVAARAGLPAIILHGTATLALAVSRVVDHEFEGRADTVSRIAGRFGAMVQMPSTLLLQIFPPRAGVVRFAVANDRGERALRDGLVALRDAVASP